MYYKKMGRFKVHSDEVVQEARYRVSLKRDLRRHNIRFENDLSTETLEDLHNIVTK